MVEALRSSGVANYIEFKPLTGFLYGKGVAPALLQLDLSRNREMSAAGREGGGGGE